VVFHVRYRLTGVLPENASYTISCNDEPVQITSTEFVTFAEGPFTLTGGTTSEVSVTIVMNAPDLTAELPGVVVVAEPIAPEYMTTGYLLGTTLHPTEGVTQLHYSTDFAFDTTGNRMAKDLAGFTYRITTSGTPGDGQLLTVTYDAGKLTLDPLGDFTADSSGAVLAADDYGYPTLTRTVTIQSIDPGEVFELNFFRCPTPADVDPDTSESIYQNYWSTEHPDTETAAEIKAALNSLVTTAASTANG
jgi:hypothetical protein